ncbi:hypothetical protein ACFQX6_23280 [Streptosporangium lutulentum]
MHDLAPARPHPLERGHDEISGPRSRTADDRFAELVDREFGVPQRVPMAARTSSVWPGVIRTSSEKPTWDTGRADSAAIHRGRSRAGSR